MRGTHGDPYDPMVRRANEKRRETQAEITNGFLQGTVTRLEQQLAEERSAHATTRFRLRQLEHENAELREHIAAMRGEQP